MRANSLDLKKVSIHDSFWSKHVDLVRNAIIPYQWEAMNDRIPDAESSHCLENFKIAAGRAKGDFTEQFSRTQTLQNGWKQWDFPLPAIRMKYWKKQQMK